MTKLIPLKEIIAKAIDKRWQKFIKLGAQAKALDNVKYKTDTDNIYLKMKELVLDMVCVEHYVLESNPQIRGLWQSLKDFKPETDNEKVQKS